MTEFLQRAFELASRLPVEEQDALAARLIEKIRPASGRAVIESSDPVAGEAMERAPVSETEMAELRALAEHDPGVAAALWLSQRGGLAFDDTNNR